MCYIVAKSSQIAKFMGPTWLLSANDGPHVGPMSLTLRVAILPIAVYIVHPWSQSRLEINYDLYHTAHGSATKENSISLASLWIFSHRSSAFNWSCCSITESAFDSNFWGRYETCSLSKVCLITIFSNYAVQLKFVKWVFGHNDENDRIDWYHPHMGTGNVVPLSNTIAFIFSENRNINKQKDR